MKPESAVPRPERVAEFFGKHRTGLVTLVFTDLVDSTRLKQQLGDTRAVALIQQHHSQVRDWLRAFAEAAEVETAGDSFVLLFARPSDAVRFALGLHGRNSQLSAQAGERLEDRIAIHAGEVFVQDQVEHAKLFGSQVDVCGRVQNLAQGHQTLMTRFVFDNARAVLRGTDVEGAHGLQWFNHGRYRLKGLEEPVEVCEVRVGSDGPVTPPTSSEKAQRVMGEGELVLGWRPGMGLVVPGTEWVLEEKLGEGGFGEVWLGGHGQLKDRRVFKFCFRADRIRALKREVTLFRMLKERIGVHPNIVRLHEVCFEQPPYYIEEEFVEGRDLRHWCEEQGGIGRVAQETRLEIVAQVAEALQAAHQCGVIHRDVKPGNILVSGPKAEMRIPKLEVKLTDFGIGQVVSEEVLAGMTRGGFTQTVIGDSSSSQTGSQMYMAPELLAGKPASIRSDIYSLGVVLYQLLVSDFAQPVTGDWSADIEDSLLRDDLHHCLAGKLDCRFADAAQLAQQLRCLPQRRKRAARKAVLGGTAAVLGLAAALALGWGLFHGYVGRGEHSGQATFANSTIPEKSIAVLPFDNFSVERDTEYLNEGLTEEITSALSRIAGLKVTARNSAFALKGKNEDIRKVGELLRVSTVLEGSVRKEGKQVRVTAQLIDASNGYHLWSETYDRSIDNMLAVQEEIARKIAGKLQGEVGAGMVQTKSTDPKAYKLYLQARFFWNKRTESGLKEAIRLFQDAIKQDPNYADARAGLAATYFLIPQFSYVRPSDFHALARAAATRALELNPESAEAHAVLAQLQTLAGDFKGAEEHYRVAINANPNYATARHWYGLYLSSQDRREEGLQQLKAAIEIDPLSPAIRSTIPQWYYLGGDCDRAVEEAKKVIKIFPDFVVARQMLIEALAAKGAYLEALDATDRARALFPDPQNYFLGYKAFLLGRLGRENEARLLLEEARQQIGRDRPIDLVVFMVHFGLHDYESAITALEQMAQAGLLSDVELGKAPFLRELQNNPRFQKLVEVLKNGGTGSVEPAK